MQISHMTYAQLDQSQLDKLTDLEQELGSWIVALKPEQINLADLSEKDLTQLKTAESELGIVLLALKKPSA